jgi:excisionase family DNA binding protein
MPNIYTVEEAAEKLRKGRTWTWGEVRAGRLRSFKIGARRVVSEDALNEFIERAMATSAVSGGAGDDAPF